MLPVVMTTHPATAWIRQALQAELRGEWATARRAWQQGWSARLDPDDALAIYCGQQYDALTRDHPDARWAPPRVSRRPPVERALS